jgi:hypothetical protein
LKAETGASQATDRLRHKDKRKNALMRGIINNNSPEIPPTYATAQALGEPDQAVNSEYGPNAHPSGWREAVLEGRTSRHPA